MKSTFTHRSQNLQKDKPLVYTAMSKHLFFFRMHISKFVFEHDAVPLNPFMISEYFMLDTVDRDVIREANNNLVKRADEIWQFGPVSDGALAEIEIANKKGKTVRFFKIEKNKDIIEVDKKTVELEAEVAEMRHLL